MRVDIHTTKTWLLRALAAPLGLAAAVVAAALLWPLPDGMNRRDSTVVRYNDGTPAHIFLSPDDKWRLHTELERVDDDYIEALVALEDERFWWHPGVDPIAIGRATLSNLYHGEVVSGASTITMQLVRLMEPRPRTLWSKCIEAFRALQLELHYSKEEILESYLRYVPFGRNIEGMAAASHAYFGHAATDLAPREIATLLAVPQNPNDHYPRPENAAALRRTRDRIAARLIARSALPRGENEDAIAADELAEQITSAPVPTELRPFPRDVPHAAYWLRAQTNGAEEIQTTLDAGLQRIVDRLVGNRRHWAETRDIHNVGVVVVDHEAGAVRAIAGNFDFYANKHGSKIPTFAVPRSTGSLLKPFVYARAIDAGIAGPRHLVRDVPVRYGEYTPENYNGRFSGLVPLEEALAQSLNVPFVNLVGQLGIDDFLGTMRQLGAAHLEADPGFYGLSVAVGGIAATPFEVATAYAALARGGRPTAVRLRPDAAVTDPLDEPVVGPGAAWLTRRALSRRDRPDFPARRHMTGTPPTIAWKTGTSAGHRDAWTAGFGPNYTVAVWLGNVDNDSSPSLVGSQAAAPLFFDIVEAVDDPPDALPDPPAEDLTRVEVCAYSGHLPKPACPETREVLLPVHNVPTERCPYHVRRAVDPETGRALSKDCRDAHRSVTKTFVVWPSGIQRWMRDRGADVPTLPPYAPDCRPHSTERGPEILSPPGDSQLVMIPGVPADEQEVPLEANGESGTTLSWFVDGEFIGKAPADGRLWWTPSPGRHEFVVMDPDGRRARRYLEVR